jgi:ABC-type multidrug transport system fused ATPase/permease subunit
MKIKSGVVARHIVRLLPQGTIKRLLLLLCFQLIATALDVSALLLLGLLTKSGLDYVQGSIVSLNAPILNMTPLANQDFETQFTYLSILVLGLFTLRTIISIWGNKKTLDYLGVQAARASTNFIERLFSSKPQFVLSRNSQQLLYGTTIGIDNLVLVYMGSLVLFIAESLFLTVMIISLLYIQPLTGICAVFIFGFSGYLINKISSSRAKELSEDSSSISVNYNQGLLETLTLYRELLLRGAISSSTIGIHRLRNKYLSLRSQLIFLPILSKYLFEFVLIIGSAIVATIQLATSNVNGAIASVVVFLAASSRILPSIIRLQSASLSLKQAEGGGQITLKQLDKIAQNRDLTMKSLDLNEEIKNDSAFLDIKEVSFSYEGNAEFAIKNVSLKINKGDLVAIVGESGSGKSTLADLVLGMHEPKSGLIQIMGMPPREVFSKFPGFLAYVPQDIAIVDGDIQRNVTLGAELEDNERLIDSLKKAALWEDVQKMPNGINSLVGERGVKLSGGQRQRLGIARALFSNPSIIVFDEATSSLDPITEKSVTEAIYTKRGDVTLIVIAHRLSTVRNADVVLLLDNGEAIASGTFDDVRTKAPKFDEQAKLVNL